MDEETLMLILKIGITVGSLILLWTFKKNIMNILNDIVNIGTNKYKGKSVDEIREEMEMKMDEVLK